MRLDPMRMQRARSGLAEAAVAVAVRNAKNVRRVQKRGAEVAGRLLRRAEKKREKT